MDTKKSDAHVKGLYTERSDTHITRSFIDVEEYFAHTEHDVNIKYDENVKHYANAETEIVWEDTSDTGSDFDDDSPMEFVANQIVIRITTG